MFDEVDVDADKVDVDKAVVDRRDVDVEGVDGNDEGGPLIRRSTAAVVPLSLAAARRLAAAVAVAVTERRPRAVGARGAGLGALAGARGVRRSEVARDRPPLPLQTGGPGSHLI